MPVYKVGDRVVHSRYGAGEIVAVDDKGSPGQPLWYYSIETGALTLWVPVEEEGGSSLHLPISRADHQPLSDLLNSKAEKFPDNRYQRSAQLARRMHNATPTELCLAIRDLSFRALRRNLNSNDVRILKRAQTLLAQEWE